MTRAFIVSTRVAALAAAGVITYACAGRVADPILFEQSFERTGAPPIAVRVLLRPEHRGIAARYTDAVTYSLQQLNGRSWFTPRQPLTLVDPPAAEDDSADRIVLARVRGWTTGQSMAAELAVARALARDAVSRALDARSLPPWFVDGLVEHLARRSTQNLFARDNNTPGFAEWEGRDFGGFVPRRLPMRSLAESAAPPVDAYRSNPAVNPDSTSPENRERLAGKTVVVLATLDQWVGRPAGDAIIDEFVGRFGTTRPTVATFIHTASAVAGQDLAWLLVPAFGSPAVVDYGVATLTSEAAAGGFETRVGVVRYGDGVFTGSTAPRVGDFENGRGVVVAVAFESGETVRAAWDGRDHRREFVFKSASRAVSAIVDPDRAMLLDLKRTNNGRTLQPAAAGAALRWSARWAVWLENLLLGYASLV